MIDSLHIQNYRLFKDLKIDKLGQVNLIAGKNNTGKTALLEAIELWGMTIDFSNSFARSLFSRQEVDKYLTPKEALNKITNNSNCKSIKIDDLEIYLADDSDYSHLLAYKEFSTYKNESIRINIAELWNLDDGQKLVTSSYHIEDKKVYFIPLDTSFDYFGFWSKIELNNPKNVFDNFKEDISEIMRVLDQNIIEVFIDAIYKKPRFRLNNEEKAHPLKRLGDGANRLFLIALALINSKGNILAIDEFEVGLHHSIQKQLWEIIFKYAKLWNIQVFVTTHSRDTVEAFHDVSTKEEYKDMGQYMRLQKSSQSDDIEAVIYTEKSLDTAFDLNLETR
jgi:AAA15 family ATPase/GTPase